VIVHELYEAPPHALAAALSDFEESFTYPLGDEERFHISHGEDYTRFFRAMGDSVTFVVTDKRAERVYATLSLVPRELVSPQGHKIHAVYLCDLKASPGIRRGWALLKVFDAAHAWALRLRPRVTAAYGVVMRGSERTPANYSGRLGMPAFRRVAEISILSVPTRLAAKGSVSRGTVEVERVSIDALADAFSELTRGSWVPRGGTRGDRSTVEGEAFRAVDGSACGLLEDTRNAKRLLLTGGREILSAHLSSFSARSSEGARALIDATRERAAELGFDSLFVSPPDSASGRLDLESLDGVGVASADVFAVRVSSESPWAINTAEI